MSKKRYLFRPQFLHPLRPPVTHWKDSEEMHDVLHKLPGTDIWRLSFRLQGVREQKADMRVFLTLRGQKLTETWSYLYEPVDAK